MRGNRIVIPASLRRDMKKKIHAGHQGINACLRRAREVLFWPNMSVEIRQFVEACSTCAAFAPAQALESLISHDIPPGPWLKLAADIFEIKGRNYLVLEDYFSKFIEVDFLPDTLSRTVIHKVKHHLARHGIPRLIISDGGPQFRAKEFQDFAKTWNFAHNMTSPGHSRSNGQAESGVKIVKRLFLKCARSGDDPYLGLLALRNTPDVVLKSSPAQRLFGRATRTSLPTSPALLDFSPPSVSDTHAKLLDKQNAMAQQHDKSVRDLQRLEAGAIVRHRNPLQYKPTWEEARITKQVSPRTYELQTSQGAIMKRNRRFLMPQREENGDEYSRSTIPESPSVHSPEAYPEEWPGQNMTSASSRYPEPAADAEPDLSLQYSRSGRLVRPPKRLDL